MTRKKKIQINFLDQRTPVDKREKSIKDVFYSANQIMLNYYIMVLKKDPRKIKPKYTITFAYP